MITTTDQNLKIRAAVSKNTIYKTKCDSWEYIVYLGYYNERHIYCSFRDPMMVTIDQYHTRKEYLTDIENRFYDIVKNKTEDKKLEIPLSWLMVQTSYGHIISVKQYKLLTFKYDIELIIPSLSTLRDEIDELLCSENIHKYNNINLVWILSRYNNILGIKQEHMDEDKIERLKEKYKIYNKEINRQRYIERNNLDEDEINSYEKRKFNSLKTFKIFIIQMCIIKLQSMLFKTQGTPWKI